MSAKRFRKFPNVKKGFPTKIKKAYKKLNYTRKKQHIIIKTLYVQNKE